MRRAILTAGGFAILAAMGCAPDGSIDPSLIPSEDEPASSIEVRPDTPGNNLQFNFDKSELVETFASSDGFFLIHYTRSGTNAVPDDDADSSGVPDFVEEVADVYVDVLAFYRDELGYDPPPSDEDIADNGGDGRFDVYLVDFAGVGDGAFAVDQCLPGEPDRCAGYMTQENDFAGYGYPSTLVANRILGSHEFFHAVQAGYDHGQNSVANEGSAVWATEAFDPSLEDFEAFIPGYLDNPDQPLNQPLPGPVDPFSYGAGLLFKFVEERFGADAVREIWEGCVDGANGVANPDWFDVLDDVITNHGSTFADAFTEFVTWNLHTGPFADETSYADAAAYPRLRIDSVSLPYTDDSLRVFYASSQGFGAGPDGRAQMTAALVATATAPDALDGVRLLLVAEDDGVRTVKEVADPSQGTETIDTSTATKLDVVVINTNRDGDSKKPGLCIGTTEEVAACIASLGNGEGGAGGGAGGGSETGGAGEGGGTAGDDGEGDGCGCRLAPSGGPSPGALVVSALFAAAVGARRRRTPSR